ncbi:Gluconate 2-dehydrogenase cytochrome c subunit precursor [Pragia fontium]|uniref:c-type cytochrome n=1 Tax=Pragia fontium TaxID=82985 RepID=UPI000E04BB82|nr:c-type cytochrome [Pragia fontium]SUB83655.1 Gluconate 2-dehydrogenase cytochrome c subunit precursor [Pragia fontium]
MMRLKRVLGWCVAIVAVVGVAGLWYSSHPEIEPLNASNPAKFSDEMVARGKLLADAGDCAVCHTSKDGVTNTGGLAIEIPFGTIYTTNITPDVETGIGSWSFDAFKRAMREGIDREGNYLYPAFPYTAFTKTSDADLEALYAYLMSQTAVKSHNPKTDLSFPFNIRRGISAWNLLFLSPGAYQPDTAQSEEWNRGAYLVEGLGHCSACHTPRNLMFAEKTGADYLGGGVAEGWIAPALNQHSPSPLGWNKQELVEYMRTGFSINHGVAAGPMAPVVKEGLSAQSDADLMAIATYLLSFQGSETKIPDGDREQAAADINLKAYSQIEPLTSQGARIFSGACMACHNQDSGPVLNGVKPSIALNSNLYESSPDNMIHIILNGIQSPATDKLGYMPAFRYNMNDQQIVALLSYLREDFAKQPAWPDLAERVKQIRLETEKDN